MLQWFIVLFTATSGAASILGGIFARIRRGAMERLTELRDGRIQSHTTLTQRQDGQTTGNETLVAINTQFTTLVERLAPPPEKDG
jgi:hypothetical protein